MKKLPYFPKHPGTKLELRGGFNPLAVSGRPFGLRVASGLRVAEARA